VCRSYGLGDKGRVGLAPGRGRAEQPQHVEGRAPSPNLPMGNGHGAIKENETGIQKEAKQGER
jgi:hypothetical protein